MTFIIDAIDDALDAIADDIEDALDDLGDEIEESLDNSEFEELGDEIEDALDEIGDEIEDALDDLRDLVEDNPDNLPPDELGDLIEDALDDIGDQVEDTLDELGNQVEDALDGSDLEGLGDDIEDALDDIGDNIEDNLDELGDDIEDTLDNLGSELGDDFFFAALDKDTWSDKWEDNTLIQKEGIELFQPPIISNNEFDIATDLYSSENITQFILGNDTLVALFSSTSSQALDDTTFIYDLETGLLSFNPDDLIDTDILKLKSIDLDTDDFTSF